MDLAIMVLGIMPILRWRWIRRRGPSLFPWIFWLPPKSRTKSVGVMRRPRTVFGNDERRKSGKRHKTLRSSSIRFVTLRRSGNSIVARGITSEASLAAVPPFLRSLPGLRHRGKYVWPSWGTRPGTVHRSGMAQTIRMGMDGTRVGGPAPTRPRPPCCLKPSIRPLPLRLRPVHHCARRTLI